MNKWIRDIMKPTLEFITKLAFDAGDILQSYVGKDLDVQHKSRTDLVTRADHASEKFLISSIRKAFPTHAINAEESGEWEGNEKHKWYLDPLDGTNNYAHGIPIYCVSIGYAYEDEVILGVVYDPTRKEFFCAERGKGATLNGDPIHVSQESELINCMLGTGFPNNRWGGANDNTINFFEFSKISQAVRRLGSAALDVVYVAAGRLDGFWEISVHEWDVAAGGLIVQEAGGVVTDLFGGSDFLTKPVSLIAANPAIHAKMQDVLERVRRETT